MNTIKLLEKIKNFYLLFEDDNGKNPTDGSENSERATSKDSAPRQPLPPSEEQKSEPGSKPPQQQLDNSIKEFFKGLLDDFASWKKAAGDNEKTFIDFIEYLKKLSGINISKIDKIIN